MEYASQIEEEAFLSREELLRNIDSLRPSTRHPSLDLVVVDDKEYKRLRKELAEGFTKKQLQSYINYVYAPEKIKVTPEVEPAWKTWMTAFEWRPGSRSFGISMLDTQNLRAVIGRKKDSKMDWILRSIWSVSSKEELREFGEVNYTERTSGPIALLISHGKSVFLQTVETTHWV
jgi:hypothetical protein